MLIGFLDYKHREKTEDLAWFSLFVRKLMGGFKHGQELVSSVCFFLASVQNDTAKIRRHDQSAKLLVVYVYNINICIYVRIFYARDSWPTTAQTWGSCSPDLSLGKRRRTR